MKFLRLDNHAGNYSCVNVVFPIGSDAVCSRQTCVMCSGSKTTHVCCETVTFRFAKNHATIALWGLSKYRPLAFGHCRGAHVSCSTIRFVWRRLDTVALHDGANDTPPRLRECAQVTPMFSPRDRESESVLSKRSRAFAVLAEKPRQLLPAFRFA